LAKYSAGSVGQQDPLQADAEIAMLDHQAVILERQRRITVARLNVLMHDPPEQRLELPPRELPVPDTTFIHQDLTPRAWALRPELRAADAMVEASRENVSLERRSQWPMTSFGAAYDRFWSEPELRLSASVMLSLPIYPGRLAAARTEARARLAGSEARREVVRDSIALQVEEAAARLHEMAHDLSISRGRLVPLAERTVRATRAGYEANRSDFLTLLNSVRDLLRARLEADASFAMLHQARADLDRALGEAPPAFDERDGQP
jgi:outer membrane protein TolC